MAGKRLSLGAKIGIVIGCVAVAILGVMVFIKMSGTSLARPEPGAGANASASSGTTFQGEFSASAVSSAAGSSSASSAASTGMLQGSDGSTKEGDVYGKLRSVTYSDSGDMLGNLYTVEAYRADDGSTVVTVREAKMHSDPIEVGEYRADDDLLDQVSAVIDRAGMKEWGELPPSEFIAYDAPTESLRAELESADPDDRWPKRFSYTFNDELPEGGAEAIREIYQLMMANTGQDRLIRSYTENTR